MEKTLTAVVVDVKKLMNIAGEHGGHLRELFALSSTTASKAELLAAVASIKNSFQHFKDHSLAQTYKPEEEYNAEKARNALEDRRRKEMLDIILESSKRVGGLQASLNAALKKLRDTEKALDQLKAENMEYRNANIELERTVQNQDRRMNQLEEEMARNRLKQNKYETELAHLLKTTREAAPVTQAPVLSSSSPPILELSSKTQLISTPRTEIIDAKEAPPSGNNTTEIRQTLETEVSTAGTVKMDAITSVGQTFDDSIDLDAEELPLEDNEVAWMAQTVKELQSQRAVASDASLPALVSSSAAVSDELPYPHDTPSAHAQVLAMQTSSSLRSLLTSSTQSLMPSGRLSVCSESTDAGVERGMSSVLSDLLNAAQSLEADLQQHRNASKESIVAPVVAVAPIAEASAHAISADVLARIDERLKQIEQSVTSGSEVKFATLRRSFESGQEHLQRQVHECAARVMAFEQVLLQLDEEHSALLEAQRAQAQEHGSGMAAYFAALDQLVGVVDVLQAGLVRQEGLAVDVGKKVARVLGAPAGVPHRQSMITSAVLPADPSARVVCATGLRESGETVNSPSGQSALAQSQAANPETGAHFTISDATPNYKALLASDAEVNRLVDAVLSKHPKPPASAESKTAKGRGRSSVGKIPI